MQEQPVGDALQGISGVVLLTCFFGMVVIIEKAVSCNGSFSSGFMFCLGKVRQIHEAEAVESPRAETEPVVVFLILFCAYSHSLTTL